MEGILKSEVFFVVATVALVLISAGFLVVLAYALKIMRNMREISEIAKREAELLSQDLDDLRIKVKTEGSLWGGLKTMWASVTGRRKGRK